MTLAAVAPGCGPRGLDEEPALRVVESPFVDALRSDTDREPATFCIEPIRNRSEVIEDGDPRLSSLDEAIRDAFVEMGFAVASRLPVKTRKGTSSIAGYW